MDYTADAPDATADGALSYDDTLAYDAQLPAGGSLAERIGRNKVYLPSEASAPRAVGKRKRGDEDAEMEAVVDEDDADEDNDPTLRSNALLLHGTPITHLPTARIFAYATHFEAHPVALEWVSDDTCVLVFESRASALSAARLLQKSAAEEPDEDGLVLAQPIPVAMWPPEERIQQSLGRGDGLKGAVFLRRARADDVKARGAKQASAFYAKHGEGAGKEVFNPATGRWEAPPDDAPRKRRRRDATPEDGVADVRAALDDELDAFLAEDSPPPEELVEAPSSRMRSDFIAHDGRTLLQRTSVLRAHDDDGLPLLTPTDIGGGERARNGRRREGGRRDSGRREGGRRNDGEGGRRGDGEGGRGPRGGRRRGGDDGGDRAKGTERPKKSQQELDAELDAFLNERT